MKIFVDCYSTKNSNSFKNVRFSCIGILRFYTLYRKTLKNKFWLIQLFS